ncbi:hypothetical protein [Sphaerimonospora mesophila]|uniref:hypothetical protein n=1 Tax=Sphaerimonospora mesophila TaxID=37483 RepID=UPI0006E46168
METAQHIVAQTISLLVVAWVVGYTLLRAHEAVTALAEKREEQARPRTKTPKDSDGAPRRGSMAYASQQWAKGNLSAPLWAAVAGAAGAGKATVAGARWVRDKVTGRTDDPKAADTAGAGSEDTPTGPTGGSGDDQSRARRGWSWKDRSASARPGTSGSAPDDEQPESVIHDDDTYDTTAGGGSDGSPRWDTPRQGTPGTGQDGTPGWAPRGDEDFEIEVEVIGTRPNTPPPPALGRPIPALAAPESDTPTVPQPGPPQTGGPVFPPPIVPSEVAAASAVAVLARTGESTVEERTEIDMGQNLAIPGTSSGTTPSTTRPGGGLAPAGGTHTDAMAFSRKIEQAVNITGDTIARAEAQITASLKAAWAAVDGLAQVGISGQVMDRWAGAVISLEETRRAASQLKQQVEAAKEAVTAAKRTQGKTGDAIQQAVTSAGKSAANSTRYYGKH